MWGVGCLLASQVFDIHPFFSSRTKYEGLTAIGNVLGRRGLQDLIAKYNVDVLREVGWSMAIDMAAVGVVSTMP